MVAKNKTVGRYAPSPSGDLHFGNLRTALLCWLQVRLQGGVFKLRMDDLDLPRVVAGSAEKSLRDLEWLGLDWDGEIVYQSQRTELYQHALDQLHKQGLVYECFCSRKDIQQAASAPHAQQGVYPRTCANLEKQLAEIKRQKKAPAQRVCVNDAEIVFIDGCLGEYRDQLSHSCGDFVVKRSDELFAYQLATAVDDMKQGVTHVLRGEDLIDSTARQIYLMQCLDQAHEVPEYWHVPLMLDDNKVRMAKRHGSLSIADWQSDGGTAESLVGLLAASVNLIDKPEAISTEDLLAAINMPRWLDAVKINRSNQ